MAVALLSATPAFAECLGDGCYDGLGQALFSVAAYGVLALVAVVLLVMRRVRAFLKVVGVAALIALGVPAVSWVVVAWKNLNLAKTEMAAEDVSLTGETVVHLYVGSHCGDDPCEAVRRGSDAAFVAGLQFGHIYEADLARPIDLSALPLSTTSDEGLGYATWWDDVEGLSEAEIQARMAGATRVVITQDFYFGREHGNLERALGANPQFSDLAKSETVVLAIGRLHEPGVLDLSQVSFDFIDLAQQAQVLDMPLILGSWHSTEFRMSPAQVDILRPVLCVRLDEWSCSRMLSRG